MNTVSTPISATNPLGWQTLAPPVTAARQPAPPVRGAPRTTSLEPAALLRHRAPTRVTRVERTGPTAVLSSRRWTYSLGVLCARRRVAVWGRLARGGTCTSLAVSGAYVTVMLDGIGVTLV